MRASTTDPARARNRQRTIRVDGPHPIDIHVGMRIRTRRLICGLSQGDLAKRVNISFQSVQKYEQGKNRVSASRLYEFAQALGVLPQHFFDGLEARELPGGSVAGTPPVADAELRHHLLAVMEIEDERLRRLALQVLRILSELAAAKAGDRARPSPTR